MRRSAVDIEDAVGLEDAINVGGDQHALAGDRPRAGGILELDGFNASTMIWYDWMHIGCGISADLWKCSSSLRYLASVEPWGMDVNDSRFGAVREWESTLEDEKRVEVALSRFASLLPARAGGGVTPSASSR